MKVPYAMNPSLKPLCLAILLVSISFVRASNDCAPATWSEGAIVKIRQVTSSTTSQVSSSASLPLSITSSSNAPTSTASTSSATSTAISIISTGNVTTGEVNCRYSGTTDSTVNYYTCTMLSTFYDITNDVFFMLNPQLAPDCSNIQPNTPYCVSGFIEPLRSKSGLCGPKHNNATCLGTDFQCCNSQTWTCGNSTQDCAPGTCYEGACAGDMVYSTDGTCGVQFGFRSCAGIWGDCCNFNGTCGTGTAFCATDSCQSGNCTWAISAPTPPDWSYGNSTDGTCGAANSTSCGSLWGSCCNQDNVCGSLPSDCGVGCQPEWGSCNSVISSSLSSSTMTTTPTTSSLKSSSITTTTSSLTSSSTAKTSTSVQTTSSTSTLSAISSLPSCGQTCFSNLIGQYSTLGCSSPDPSCLCSNVNFGYGIRDCSNGACGTAVASTVIAYEAAYCSSALATRSSSAIPTATGIAALPSCGQTCFNNLIGQYSTLGCSSPDPSCLCQNVNFGYGIRDCSNGACGTAVASTVIAYEATYCSSALATRSSTTASSKTTTTQPSMPTSTDGKCGAKINGATCKGSAFGNCCSVKGNCGSTPAFCGTTNLCQADFGTCTPVSTDGKCGSASTSNAMCLGSSFGNCCSVKGNCGTTSAFCSLNNLCQPDFGTCTA